MDAVAAGLRAWFNTLLFKMIAMASAAAMAGLVLFTAYREGRHAADEAAAVALAKHNAGIAAKYMRDAKAADGSRQPTAFSHAAQTGRNRLLPWPLPWMLPEP